MRDIGNFDEGIKRNQVDFGVKTPFQGNGSCLFLILVAAEMPTTLKASALVTTDCLSNQIFGLISLSRKTLRPAKRSKAQYLG